MKHFCLYFFLLSATAVCAQAGKWESTSSQALVSAYQRACAWFVQTPSYAFRMNYLSFKDHESPKALESSEGYYKKIKNSYSSEAIGIKIMQNEKLRVMLDTVGHTVTVTDPAALKPAAATAEELQALLAHAKALKKQALPTGTKYRLEFNKAARFEAYEFVIGEKGFLEQLIYYYPETREAKSSSSEKGASSLKPRLEIHLVLCEAPSKFKSSESGEEVIAYDEQQRIGLRTKYKDFKLLDYRVKTKPTTH